MTRTENRDLSGRANSGRGYLHWNIAVELLQAGRFLLMGARPRLPAWSGSLGVFSGDEAAPAGSGDDQAFVSQGG